MNVAAINSSIRKLNGSQAVLQIRFEFADGSSEGFYQAEARPANDILQQSDPNQLFIKSRIVVADDYSKSVFVSSQINRVDFIYKGGDFFRIPADYADLVELTEAQFRDRVPLNDPSRLQKRQVRRQVGDLHVSFLKLRMRGGGRVYLMDEKLVKIRADSQSYMREFLSKGTLGFRLQDGGQGYLNMANLVGYTVYPGVPDVPADSWMARPLPEN